MASSAIKLPDFAPYLDAAKYASESRATDKSSLVDIIASAGNASGALLAKDSL
jgi:hypothetical protein